MRSDYELTLRAASSRSGRKRPVCGPWLDDVEGLRRLRRRTIASVIYLTKNLDMSDKRFSLDFESVVRWASQFQVVALPGCCLGAHHGVFKKFGMLAQAGDPFPEFLSQCVTVFVPLRAIKNCNPS